MGSTSASRRPANDRSDELSADVDAKSGFLFEATLRMQIALRAQEPETIVPGDHIYGLPLRLRRCIHLLPSFDVGIGVLAPAAEPCSVSQTENMSDLSPLERAVLEALVRGDDPLLTALTLQASRAAIRDREFTGVGCFVNFSLPAGVPLTSKRQFNVGDVHLELEGCAHGAAAILFVRDGQMSFPELVVYTGDWPAHPVLKAIRYLSLSGFREERDLAEFRRQAGFA